MQKKIIETKSIHSFARAVKCWEYPQIIKLVTYESTNYNSTLAYLEELEVLDEELETELQPQIAKRTEATYDGIKLYCCRKDWREEIKKELLK